MSEHAVKKNLGGSHHLCRAVTGSPVPHPVPRLDFVKVKRDGMGPITPFTGVICVLAPHHMVLL